MSTKRKAYGISALASCFDGGSAVIAVHDEVPLLEEPPRMDYLLLEKTSERTPDDTGQTLHGLWPHLSLVTIAEYKSIGRPYRAGNLDRLWSYLHMYAADERARLPHRDDLRAVLVVSTRTPALEADVDAMRLGWKELGGGYWEVTGGAFRVFVVELDVVAEHEDDDLVRFFTHAKQRTLEARRFWAEQVGTKEARMAASELEDYDEVMRKLLETLSPEQRMAGLAPAERLAGLAPAERVAGLAPAERLVDLAPEQALLALPDDLLRTLSDDYLARFSEATREAIRKRIGR